MSNIEKNLLNKQKAIAQRVSGLLEQKGWTQRDLARKIEMKDSYVSAILAGQLNLTLKTIAILEVGLGEKLIEML